MSETDRVNSKKVLLAAKAGEIDEALSVARQLSDKTKGVMALEEAGNFLGQLHKTQNAKRVLDEACKLCLANENARWYLDFLAETRARNGLYQDNLTMIESIPEKSDKANLFISTASGILQSAGRVQQSNPN